jgi:hypothetical protein
MQPRRRKLWSHATALWLVAVLVVASSCSRSAESSNGDVTIGIDLESGQRWTAHGRAVDRDEFCPRGTRHVIEGVDPVTNDIVSVRAWSRIVDGAIMLRNTTEITLVVEHTCADGSGSFVTREQWGPDVWSVESGTGAYRELTGGGELRFATVDYMEIAPLRLYLDGTLEG